MKKIGAIALVLPGLTAGWLADEIVLNLEILKIIQLLDEIFDFSLCSTKVRYYYSRTNTF